MQASKNPKTRSISCLGQRLQVCWYILCYSRQLHKICQPTFRYGLPRYGMPTTTIGIIDAVNIRTQQPELCTVQQKNFVSEKFRQKRSSGSSSGIYFRQTPATDKESDHCPAPYPLQENQPTFNFPAILPRTVHRHLRRLSQNKSTADQVMTNRVLRECASSITESVTYLFF